MDLVLGLISWPENLGPLQTIAQGVGLFLAIVLGTTLSNLLVQPGFRKFAAYFRVPRAVDDEQDARLAANEGRLAVIEAKIDQVIEAVGTNGVLIEENRRQLNHLGLELQSVDDDVHTVMDLFDGYTTSEIKRRSERRKRQRDMELVEGGLDAADRTTD